MFATVALPVPGLLPLTYLVLPEAPVLPGMRVVVPLARRCLTGVVISLEEKSPLELRRCKSIVKCLDLQPSISPELMELAQWMADYYVCSLGEALAAMLPPEAHPEIPRQWELQPDPPLVKLRSDIANSLLSRLQTGPQTREVLLAGLPAHASQVLRTLRQKGLIRESLLTEPVPVHIPDANLQLTSDQAHAFQMIQTALQNLKYAAILLYGVTGSGKTEVYLRAIAEVLEQGRSAILLVPEIALTSHLKARIIGRFGPLVEIQHSGLSPKARMTAWQRIRQGQARVVVGARSAVFAPVQRLGLIVVDEEYETSYKQEDVPRYHARDLAVVRCRQAHAVVLMGSATPAVETFANTQQGRFQRVDLPVRVDGRKLPLIEIVDMQTEMSLTRQPPLFSQRLLDELDKRLVRQEQSILLLNRRGFAPVVMCPSCNHVVKCPDCTFGLVYYQSDDRLHCHGCGRTFSSRPACPKCGAACIRMVGAGTQKVEAELRRYFPAARILRLDQEVSRRRGYLEKVLKEFGEGQADVLIGTQMVAKGLDFPNVTLVGMVAADIALHLPDFRSEERTFQLIVQVAGRAGRGDKSGLVLVQTYNPDHPIIQLAKKHDYIKFFEREIQQRKLLEYPPFTRMALLTIKGKKLPLVWKEAEMIAGHLRQKSQRYKSTILGPVPFLHERVAGENYLQILIKCANSAYRTAILKEIVTRPALSGIRVIIDIDPQRMV